MYTSTRQIIKIQLENASVFRTLAIYNYAMVFLEQTSVCVHKKDSVSTHYLGSGFDGSEIHFRFTVPRSVEVYKWERRMFPAVRARQRTACGNYLKRRAR